MSVVGGVIFVVGGGVKGGWCVVGGDVYISGGSMKTLLHRSVEEGADLSRVALAAWLMMKANISTSTTSKLLAPTVG